VEDAHRRTRAVQGLPALAWRRGGAQSGLSQSRAAEIGIGRETMRRRGEMVERSFAHVLDRGGMRRAWLRGRANLHKRYLIHVAGLNLGVLMRTLYGQGTPREAAEAVSALIFVLQSDAALTFGLIAAIDGELAPIVIVAAHPTRN
jgi:transposase